MILYEARTTLQEVVMSKRLNLIGQKFGRLMVTKFDGRTEHHSYWDCLCDCGNTKRVTGDRLKSGNTKSCGCLRKELTIKRSTKHGQCKRGLNSRVHIIWNGMMQRCYNDRNPAYKNYGGRGIKVCRRWHSFEDFYKDVEDAPFDMTLDRKNNDGDYEPGNWRWATYVEQNNNYRRNVPILYEGEVKNITQWAIFLCMNVGTLFSRLYRGWSIERAFTTQVRRSKCLN